MSEPPLVSAVLPVWNGAEHMEECIGSILAQTFADWELLIVGEPDGPPEIKQTGLRHQAADRRVRWIENETHLGLPRSLNKCIELSRGKYIARMDVDDLSYPTRFEKQVQYLDEHPEVGVLGTQFRGVFPNRIQTYNYPTKPENIRACLLFDVCICHPTVMLRRELFITNGFRYPDMLGEDYALWLTMLDKVTFANLSEVLLDKRAISGTNIQIFLGKKLLVRAQTTNMNAISNYLHVDTAKFAINRFLLTNPKYIACENIQIAELVEWMTDSVYLLFEIERANREHRVLDDAALARTLRIRWNWILDGSLISKMPNMAHSLPRLAEKTNNPFSADLIASLQNHGYALQSCSPNRDILFIVRDSATNFVNHLTNFFTASPACVVFGVGYDCCRFMGEFTDTGCLFQIVGFCDSDPAKQGQKIYGRPVVSPSELSNLQFDYILIATRTYWGEVQLQLIGTGIPAEKILPLDIFRYKARP